MKLAIICLPHYPHNRRLILRELGSLEHTIHIFEEVQEEFEDGGGFAKLEYPRNVVPVLLENLDGDALPQRAANEEFDRIISFSDRGLLAAAMLRQGLEIGGNSLESELWVVDKGLMRERLHRSRLSRIRFKVSSLDMLIEDAAELPLPVVVKPTRLGGSFCVELIDSGEAFHAYIARCTSNRIFRNNKLIIEEYMPGKEFSVEGMVVRGVIVFLGVTESHTSGVPYFVGTGHDFFTCHQDAERIYEFTSDVIRCLKLYDCPFHIEMKYTEGGFEVVEVHSRFAGAMVMELVYQATGVRAFARYVETLTGDSFEYSRPSDGSICSQQLLCAKEGIIREISIDPEIVKDPRVISFAIDYSIGDTIEADIVPLNYVGYITFRSESLEDANRFRARVNNGFLIEVR